jgi:hypothetical protein
MIDQPSAAQPSFIYARICTIAAILLGIFVAWITNATPLAAGIIVGGIVLGIKLDQRLKSWPLAIIAIIAVNLASILYAYQMINFGITMSVWVLVPTLVLLFSGNPIKEIQNAESGQDTPKNNE